MNVEAVRPYYNEMERGSGRGGGASNEVGEATPMDKRLITTTPLFKLARLVLPEYLLLQWFGRKIPVRTESRRAR